MSDYCIWNPRISGAGDDAYNIPGSTKLDNTVDNGVKQLIIAGNQAPYSVDPSVAQLQAADSLGINQIIGVVNHFCAQKGLTPVPYAGITNPIQWTKLAAIKTKIDAIRSAYAMSVYPWSTIFTSFAGGSGLPILGRHFAELRKAVAITISQQAWSAAGVGFAAQTYSKSGSVWVPSTFSGGISGAASALVNIRGGNGVSIKGAVQRILFASQAASAIEAGKALYFTLIANGQAFSDPTGTYSNPVSSLTFSLAWKTPSPASVTSLSDITASNPLLSGAAANLATYGPFLITNSMTFGASYGVCFAFDNDVAIQNGLVFTANPNWQFGQSSGSVIGYFTYQ